MMRVHILIVFMCLILNGNCYNIDTKYPIVYFYNNVQLNSSRILGNTHFGYSVILYKGSPYSQSWVQIGAPKSNDTNNNYFEPGAVFRCPISQPCRLFPLDASVKYSEPVENGIKKYQPKKDEAWIGGSMDIDMKNERVVVCGHRWINNKTYPLIPKNEYEYHITGACYWSKTNENVTSELLPITGIQKKWWADGVFIHSKGQAGLSVHFPFSSTPQFVIGAPGINNWKGAMIKYEDNKKPYEHLSIFEAKTVSTFSYFGYAISSGCFFLPNKLLYVVGAPRAEAFKGNIAVLDISRETLKMIDSKQGGTTGEYFGAAIAVADINGDKLDDIIVGAPRHSVQMDEGKINIYYGHSDGKLRQPNKITSITGKAIGGQFGTAIQSLGDLDMDGFADIAVGAPYENDNHGVVYIYNGQEKEDSLKLSQKIEGKNIHPLIKGFGVSFSRPADIDGNYVDDLAVGSYLSENAVLLRSRPVVTLKIRKNGRNLNLERNSTSFQIDICSLYRGKYLPEQLNVVRKIKIDDSNRRVHLREDRTGQVEHVKTLTLKERNELCEKFNFALIPTTNYLDPIIIIASLDIPESSGPSQPILINQHRRSVDNFCKNCPIVKKATSTKEIKITIPYALNCGSDNKCDADLSVKAEFQNLGAKNKFIIGSQSFVSLKITVHNKKEDAYLTQIEVKLPESVDLQEVPTNCNEDVKNFTLVTCSVENPLKTNASKTITLNFDMTYITNSSQQSVSFEINAVSKSNELNKADNTIISNLHLGTDASIEIKGNSEQDIYYYQNKTKLLNATHLYKVQKSGVSPLNFFHLDIQIPVALNTKNDGAQKILSIFQPIGVQGDQSFFCTWDEPYNTIEEKMDTMEDIGTMRSKRSTLTNPTVTTKKSNDTSKMYIVPLSNKVAFLNCSSADVVCKNIACEIGPFKNALKVASLQIKMVLNMTMLEKYVLKKNKQSIIYLSTDGVVKEIGGHRHAYTRISNVFLPEPVAQKIALWIIIVSIIVGILILMLITLGLIKAGFFKRKEKEELEARKQQEDEENSSVPTSLCFLDWQLSHVGPPVLDLFYFMYACTDKKLRDEHYDDLIKHYHKTLTERTAELGSNIEKLYPFSVLQEQLLKFGRYGMAIGIMLLQFLLSDATEIPDINKVFDEDDPLAAMEKFNITSKNEAIYNIRMRGVILHCVEKNYI